MTHRTFYRTGQSRKPHYGAVVFDEGDGKSSRRTSPQPEPTHWHKIKTGEVNAKGLGFNQAALLKFFVGILREAFGGRVKNSSANELRTWRYQASICKPRGAEGKNGGQSGKHETIGGAG